MPLAREQADVGNDERRQVIERDLRRESRIETAAQQFVAVIECGEPSADNQRDQRGAAQVHRLQRDRNKFAYTFHGAAA